MCKLYWKLGLLTLLLVTIYLFLCLYPIKMNIYKRVEGIQWELENQDESEKLSVNIEGQYVKYLLHSFHCDYFEGKLEISSYPFTEDKNFFMFRINLRSDYYQMVSFSDGISMGKLVYGNGYTSDIHNLGTIFQMEPMEQGIIWLNDSSQIISFPSTNREEAVELLDEMLPSEVREIERE